MIFYNGEKRGILLYPHFIQMKNHRNINLLIEINNYYRLNSYLISTTYKYCLVYPNITKRIIILNFINHEEINKELEQFFQYINKQNRTVEHIQDGIHNKNTYITYMQITYIKQESKYD